MLAWLERHQLLVLGLAGLLLAAGVGVRQLDRDTPPALIFHDDASLPPGAPIRVYVTGAVASPGVYELRSGDRVADALAVAGGASEGADLDALNLARRVRDGERVSVDRRGGSSTVNARGEPLPPGTKLDINLATEAQLDQLPGIGEAYSRRIVDSRKVDGPFKSTQELVERKVLPKATYDRISDMVMVSGR
jgi:competence protein ComEA